MESVRKLNIVKKYSKNGKTYQFLVHYDHPVGVLTMIAPIATRVDMPEINHSPKYGKDTKSILKKNKLERKSGIQRVWRTTYPSTHSNQSKKISR